MSKATDKALDPDALWQQFRHREDRQARQELIVHYASLVNYVAGRVAVGLPGYVDRDDLLSYGIMGLLDAVGRFEPERGLKFETFAIPRIRGSILDGLRKEDWVPRRTREKVKRYERAVLKLQTELEREPTDKEIRQELQLSEPQYHKLMVEVGWLSLHSLEELVGIGKEGEEVFLGDLVEDDEAPLPGARLLEAEEVKLLGEAIDSLPQREAYVINLYYYSGLTVKEISQVLGVSEPRVSQIHGKALLRLRRNLQSYSE